MLSTKRGYYLYSTLFYSILQIDEQIYQYLKECKDNIDHNIDGAVLGDELISIMLQNGFLCKDFEDEWNSFYLSCHNARTDDKNIHLTIIPTMNCCFSCSYCFEKHKYKSIISSDVIGSIINYVSIKRPSSLHVTWFGGEPLLAANSMASFTDKLLDQYRGDYTSDIITTGFPINQNVLNVIKGCHISEIQITIDGARENHNRVKYTSGCNDTFTKVLDNIESITSSMPNVTCIIRVNVTKNNINDIPTLKSIIATRFPGKRVWLSPSLVVENGSICPEHLFRSEDFRTISRKWWLENKIASKWIYGFNSTECAIRNPSSFVIMPDGSLYRCWETVGEPECCIGHIREDGKIAYSNYNDILENKLNIFDPLLDNTCKICPYLPLCYGGCPSKNINTKGKIRFQCSSYKEHLEEWIELYLDYISQ